MTVAIERNGDTTLLVRSPFHFYDFFGGKQFSGTVKSFVHGIEPDSCWGGEGIRAMYGIRTIDTNGVVLDSLSLLGRYDHTRIAFLSARYDDYGITAIGLLDSSRQKMVLARFGYDGQMRWLKTYPFAMTLAPFTFWPDRDQGFYLCYSGSYGVSSFARFDSAGTLRSREDLLPVFPVRGLGGQTSSVSADGGRTYSYTNYYYIPRDTAFVIQQDKFGNRRYAFSFRGKMLTHVPLADNSVLVFRVLEWDSIRFSTGVRVTLHQIQALRLDSTGQIVWLRDLVSRADNRDVEQMREPFVAPDGSIHFWFFSSRSGFTDVKTVYGRISGVQRFDPSATLRTAVGRLSAYPNPAVDQIRLEGLTRPTPISISSATGQVVLQRLHRPEEAINLSTLPAGLYFLSTEDGRKLRFVVGR